MIRKTTAFAICLMLVYSCIILPETAQATPLAPFIDLQEKGLTLVTDGEGLQGWDGTARNLTVTIGGNVRFALLYWNGSTACPTIADPCPVTEPFADQEVSFNGTPITGTIIGTETEAQMSSNPRLHVGYFADVTSIVSAAGTGMKSFSFADSNTASNLQTLNGASLVVGYTDAANPNTYRVIIWDGLDFAKADSFAVGDNRTTQAVTFNHGVGLNSRQAELFIGNGGSLASLPDSLAISNNPAVLNSLDSSDGNLWDDDQHSVNIPAGVGTTTVQLNSILANQQTPSACGHGYWKNHTTRWAATGFSPNQTVGSVFSAASAYPSLASQTLLQALKNGGGSGSLGAAKILMRSAIAALLNSAHPELNYPRTTAEVISAVNAALSSNNRQTMLNLADDLEADNSLPCEFSAGVQTSDTITWEFAALRVPQGDVTAPTCPGVVNPGPPAQNTATVQDTESGLAELLITKSENADTVVPPYTVGTTDQVVATSTKIDQAQTSDVELKVSDLAGNTRFCTYQF